MKRRVLLLGVLAVSLLLMPFGTVFPADPATPLSGASVTVNPDIIQARLKEVDASPDLDEKTKSTLTELYRKALSHIETETANSEAARAFSKARKTAPEKAKSIRDKLEQAKKGDPAVTLDVSETTPLAEIEQLLLNEKANQAAVDAKLAGLEEQLVRQAERPNEARQRITEARQILEQISATLNKPAPAGELPVLSEARKWSLKSRWLALTTEIKMLDQELLSQPMRIELLKAERDRNARSLKRLGIRVQLLEESVNQRRRSEAEQALAEAEEKIVETVDKHEVVQNLAEQNARLTASLSSVSADLEQVASGDQRADKQAKRIEEDFRNTQQKLDIAGLSQALGRVLLEQRRQLPDTRTFRKQARAREQLIAESALRQIQHNEEQKRLRNMDEYIDALIADLPQEEIETIRDDLTDLAEKRRDLLGKAISLDDAYLRALGELDFAQRRLLDAVEAYDTFLAEHLLWIRSSAPPSLDMLLAIPQQIYQLILPGNWFEVVEVLLIRMTRSPFPVMAIILFIVLTMKSGRMRHRLEKTGKDIIKARTDRFSFTLQALGWTLLLATPWPLLLVTAGWELGASLDPTAFSRAVSRGLILVSPAFFYLQAFRMVCVPGGLAAAHFRWPDSSLRLLCRELNRLMIVFLPAGFIAVLAINLGWAGFTGFGGGLERLAFAVTMISLSLFFYRLFGPRQKTLHEFMARHPDSVLARFRYLWLALALGLPVFLIGLSLSGYLYTAGTLTGSLIDTLWLILGFIIIHQLAVRWLLMTRRKIAFETAVERRRAALAAAESEEGGAPVSEDASLQIEEPEIDLMALNEESRKLLNTIVPFTAVIGLWFIWSEVLPAFVMLEHISLWHQSAVVDGEQQLVPITLADVLLALLIAVVTVVATRRFPALLEIVLLRRFSVSSGGRYAATTLSRYSIAALGTILALSTIGGSWSQIQWLVAALSVGIGFGLQEIVANFISGIIILFERPIRVGDVVSIGDTDGTVTRIQIRATTIRNWDRQELLVPNKEFITGRLLNWSLSDQTTRIKVTVGVAYGSDVHKAMMLMQQVAEHNEHVLPEPPPSIVFDAFGDNALNLVLRCFVGAQEDRMPTLTALHVAINEKFNEAGIVIAFPQRDVHLDTSKPLDVRLHRKGGDENPA